MNNDHIPDVIIELSDRPFDATKRLYLFEDMREDTVEEYVGTWEQFKAFLNRTRPSAVVLTLAEWLHEAGLGPMDEEQVPY